MGRAAIVTRELLERAAVEGKTRRQLSTELGVSFGTVHAALARHNLTLPKGRRGRPHGSMRDSAHIKRDATFATLYRLGFTLEEIGARFSVTRERVRQVIKKYHHLDGKHGGATARAKVRRAAAQQSRDERAHKKWGCSWEQYKALRGGPGSPSHCFIQQRNNARTRKIGWELTLWQWWTIWQESGCWTERGRGRGYAMCRVNDVGPYAVGNVYIATGVQNMHDYYARRRALAAEQVPA